MKKLHILTKSTLLALLIGGTTQPAQASVYSLASKTMELIDPEGKNMVKFILTVGTAAGGVYIIDQIERKWNNFANRYQIKRNAKYCVAALAAWTFWSTVLPNSKK